jgi:hypothetical protein
MAGYPVGRLPGDSSFYGNGNDEFVCHLDPGSEHNEEARPFG